MREAERKAEVCPVNNMETDLEKIEAGETVPCMRCGCLVGFSDLGYSVEVDHLPRHVCDSCYCRIVELWVVETARKLVPPRQK